MTNYVQLFKNQMQSITNSPVSSLLYIVSCQTNLGHDHYNAFNKCSSTHFPRILTPTHSSEKKRWHTWKNNYILLVRIPQINEQVHISGKFFVTTSLNFIGNTRFNNHITIETHYSHQSMPTKAFFIQLDLYVQKKFVFWNKFSHNSS